MANSNEKFSTPSNYVANKLEIKDKAAVIMMLTKLESGIILMSNIYCRFFQAILPMLTILVDHKDNGDLCDFTRQKFASILRTYMRTNSLSEDEQPALYALKREMYDINLDPSVKQIESHVVITLRDIDDNFHTLMMNILNMAEDPDIVKWKNNSRYDNICATLNSLTNSIVYTYEDFAKAFLDGNCIVNLNKVNDSRRSDAIALNNGIDNPTSVIIAIKSCTTMLQNLYSDICCAHYNISASIDIASPITMDESDSSIEELYKSFGKVTSEAISEDVTSNGFRMNEKSSKEKKRKSNYFFPHFNLGNNEKNNGDNNTNGYHNGIDY